MTSPKRVETTFGIEREQLEDDFPCVMHPEDDCSSVLPCAECLVWVLNDPDLGQQGDTE